MMAKHREEARSLREVQRVPHSRRDGHRVLGAVYLGRGGEGSGKSANIKIFVSPSSSTSFHIAS